MKATVSHPEAMAPLVAQYAAWLVQRHGLSASSLEDETAHVDQLGFAEDPTEMELEGV